MAELNDTFGSQRGEDDMNLYAGGIDPVYPPVMRERSQTWPCRPKLEIPDPVDAEQENNVSTTLQEDGTDPTDTDKFNCLSQNKKGTARRNAWGNLSYADLITKAIQASPEKRLTLSQIYEWMIQNVAFFKDKGESNSSAGWKNSIRHNLSLHSRFMRTQNEGTGKSSWWVINPDAKPGKSPRRRATSMENSKNYEKKRNRAKKKAEQYRASLVAGGVQEDPWPDYPSPDGIRARTSSNASSVASNAQMKLSPITQHDIECDHSHLEHSPHMLWGNSSNVPKSDVYTAPADTTSLADSLADILIDTQPNLFVGDSPNMHSPHQFPIMSNFPQHQTYPTVQETNTMPQLMSNSVNPYMTDLTTLTPMTVANDDVKPTPSSAYTAAASAALSSSKKLSDFQQHVQQAQAAQQAAQQAQPAPSILRQALSEHKNTMGHRPNITTIGGNNYDEHGHHLPDEFDAFVPTAPDFSCDVNQILSHEMSFQDGSLDFSFTADPATCSAQQQMSYYMAAPPTATVNR